MERGERREVDRNGISTRLSREEWLERALDILAVEGQAKLRIVTICDALGVTRGSFYWHFKDRDDFVRSLVDFWSAHFTEQVLERISQIGGTPEERLKSLAHFVSDGGYARYDVSVRAWAAQEPDLIAAIVEEVDRRRLAFVGSLFDEIGFEGIQSEMRARATVAFLTFEAFVLAKSKDEDRSQILDAFIGAITAR